MSGKVFACISPRETKNIACTFIFFLQCLHSFQWQKNKGHLFYPLASCLYLFHSDTSVSTMFLNNSNTGDSTAFPAMYFFAFWHKEFLITWNVFAFVFWDSKPIASYPVNHGQKIIDWIIWNYITDHFSQIFSGAFPSFSCLFILLLPILEFFLHCRF